MVHMADARPLALDGPALTARAAGYIGCRTCGKATPAPATTCPRCGSTLHARFPRSLQRVLAWLLVGLMAYIPANVLPMLVTTTLGHATPNTIVGGVVELVHYGEWEIALIVFTASVVIPVSKFFVILYLVWSIRRRAPLDVHARIVLYEIVEFIGRWSMVDVFVVAILTALVHIGFIAAINPGAAAIFFAASVAFTMLSAQALDPRLIWDSAAPDPTPE